MLKTLQDLFLVFTSVLFIVDPLTAVPTFLVQDRRGDAHPHPPHGGTLVRAVPGPRHRHVLPRRAPGRPPPPARPAAPPPPPPPPPRPPGRTPPRLGAPPPAGRRA